MMVIVVVVDGGDHFGGVDDGDDEVLTAAHCELYNFLNINPLAHINEDFHREYKVLGQASSETVQIFCFSQLFRSSLKYAYFC